MCFIDNPPKPSPSWASVAIVISGCKVLLIRRVEREGDPWSGQMAFPGGMWSTSDETLIDTAIREAEEEVGLKLRRDHVAYLLTPESPRNAPHIKVLPVVFVVPHALTIRPNPEEVSEVVWVGRSDVVEGDVFVGKWTRGFTVGGKYVVWGLTYRIFKKLLGCVPLCER